MPEGLGLLAGVLKIPYGKTLTYTSPILHNGGTQLWDCSAGGAVRLSGVAKTSRITPEMFGADPTGSIDSTGAFQAYLDCMWNSGSGLDYIPANRSGVYLINGRLDWRLRNHSVIDFEGTTFQTSVDIDEWMIDLNPDATPGAWDTSQAIQVPACAGQVRQNNEIKFGRLVYTGGTHATLRNGIRCLNFRFSRFRITAELFNEGIQWAGADNWTFDHCEIKQPGYAGINHIDWGPRLDSAQTGTCILTNGSTGVVGVGTSFTSFSGAGITHLRFGQRSKTIYQISSVGDDTHLTLTSAFQGWSEAGVTAYAGVIDVTAGSVDVIGHGTTFTSLSGIGVAGTALRLGDSDERYYTIASVVSDTHLVLTEGYGIRRGLALLNKSSTVKSSDPANGKDTDFGRHKAGDQFKFGTDTAVYTIQSVTNDINGAHLMTLTGATTIGITGTVTVNNGSPTVTGNGSCNFNSLAAWGVQYVQIGTDADLYQILSVTNDNLMTLTSNVVTSQAGVAAYPCVPYYRVGDLSKANAYEQENGASVTASVTTYIRPALIGTANDSQYFIRYSGYFLAQTFIEPNAAQTCQVAQYYFSSAGIPSGGAQGDVTVIGGYQEQCNSGAVLWWFHDTQGSSAKQFASIQFYGGTWGDGNSLAVKLENVYCGTLHSGRYPGVSLEIDSFCGQIGIGEACFIATTIHWRCHRNRITRYPENRVYFGYGNQYSSASVAGYSYGQTYHFSTGNATVPMTSILPGVFQPENSGGLPPKDYTFAVSVTDSTGAGRLAIATNAATYANDLSLYPRIYARADDAGNHVNQTVTVIPDVDGSIYLDYVASGANTLALEISPISYRM